MDGDPLSTLLLQAAHSPDETISGFRIFLIIFFVLLNGFFVAAEFAIVKVRSSQIEVRTDINKGLAQAAKSIVGNLDAYLAATQLGITLASLGLGWIGESVMTGVVMKVITALGLSITEAAASGIAIGLGFAIITIMHIVFGELAPKSLAIRYPTNTTLYIAWPLKVFYFIFKPFIWLLNGFAIFLLHLLGIKPLHGTEIHSEEELKVIISESHEGGAIEETERALIQNVFEFDDRRVSNIQTLRKNISAIDVSSSLKEAIEYALREGYSRYPVYEETLDNVKGLVFTKDMFRQLMNGNGENTIEPLIRKASFISETAKIKNVLKEFQSKHIQMAVVTNEIGELTGIITMEDILEELVGEIQDEYDNEKPIVEKTGERTYLVNAHYALSDINKFIPYKLEEGEHYETLAGLISEYADGKEIKEGQQMEIDNYEAIIVKMYRNSAETVELRVKEEEFLNDLID